MIKKTLFIIALLLISVNAFSSEYEGVWEVSGMHGAVIMIHVQNGQLLLTALDARKSIPTWEALLGPISGNTAVINTIIAKYSIDQIKLEFSSTTTAKLTVLSCKPFPGNYCGPSILSLYKIF